jgi:acetyltransferase-like isoleucine patch superfamily enzyme
MDCPRRSFLKTHGTGLPPWDFREIGNGVIFETGVLCFHPENITLGDEIYLGHYSIIKGYYENQMLIGSGTWIGQNAFLHSAGGLKIGKKVGIGPGVKILTSSHKLSGGINLPILDRPLEFASVEIDDGCDIGANAVILPGVRLGKNVQVGAGAVVTKSYTDESVIKGVPAK